MFNSNSKFKQQLNLAEKARSKFRTRPSGVMNGSVREVPCTDPEIYFTRYSLKFLVAHFFLITQVMYA